MWLGGRDSSAVALRASARSHHIGVSRRSSPELCASEGGWLGVRDGIRNYLINSGLSGDGFPSIFLGRLSGERRTVEPQGSSKSVYKIRTHGPPLRVPRPAVRAAPAARQSLAARCL